MGNAETQRSQRNAEKNSAAKERTERKEWGKPAGGVFEGQMHPVRDGVGSKSVSDSVQSIIKIPLT